MLSQMTFYQKIRRLIGRKRVWREERKNWEEDDFMIYLRITLRLMISIKLRIK